MTAQQDDGALHRDEILAFLQAVYGDADRGYIHLWSLEGERKETVWLSLQETGAAPDLWRSIERHPTANWYISTAIGGADKGPFQRLKSDEAIGVTAITADIDIADPAHSKTNLPPTVAAALAVLEKEVKLPPSITVESGHGLQLWWLLREPLYFDSKEERTEFENLSRNWQSAIRWKFAGHGWTIDSTHDLARVLRLPGTQNRKTAKDGTALPVAESRIYSGNDQNRPISENLTAFPSGVRYNLSDFEEAIPLDFSGAGELPQKAATYAITGGDLILDPFAEPPRDKHESLLINSRQYRQTWDRKRAFPSGDDSASIYDLALARILSKADFSDQEIVDTCIAWRRRHGEDDPKKISRYDYWTKYVLGKVRTGAPLPELTQNGETPDTATEKVRQVQLAKEFDHKAAQKAWTVAETAEEKDAARERLMAAIVNDLGVEIDRIIRLMIEPPEYQVTIGKVTRSIGTAKALMDRSGQTELLAAILDEHGKVGHRMKAERWEPFLQSFRYAAEDLYLGGESTMIGEATTWLTHYLTNRPPLTTGGAQHGLDSGSWPFLDEEGRTCIFGPAFAKDVMFENPGIKKVHIFECLRAFGCAPPARKTLKSGKTRGNHDIYTLPESPVIPIGEEA